MINRNRVHTILFILLAGLLPEILAGYVEIKTFFNYPIMIGIISLAVFLNFGSLQVVGIISAIIYYLIIFFLGKFSGESIVEQILEVFLPLLMNIIYFMNLSDILFNLLDIIL